MARKGQNAIKVREQKKKKKAEVTVLFSTKAISSPYTVYLLSQVLGWGVPYGASDWQFVVHTC